MHGRRAWPARPATRSFPELTHFGRVFKANGYTLTNLKQVRDVSATKEQLLELSQMPPLSIMAQISYTELKTAVPDLAGAGAPGVAQNGTAGFPQQFSLFYAGKIAPNFGAMFQLTYDNDGGTIGIDNTRSALRRYGTAAGQRHPDLRPVAQQQPDGAGSVELDAGMGVSLRSE